MARTRMIKPAFFKHAELYEAEHATGMPLRVAFAGLWTVADRAGRFRWKIDLKPDVLPYDEVDMMAVLDALERYGFITSYVVDAKRYGFIPSFSEHQTFHKTERGSTLPAPIVNGESIVRHTSDTVTGTGTVTGTQLDVDDVGASAAGAVPPEPELTALFLTIAANRAITEKWGEQPNPLTPATAVTLTEALRNAGVDPHVARLSIYRQCRTSPSAVPPRSVNYFRKGIEHDWEAEKVRRAGAASRETPPPTEATASLGPKRVEHWSDKKARTEKDDADRALARARGGNVEQRKSEPDGAQWWERMLREAKAAGVHPILYAYDRMHETAEAHRASA